MFEKHGADARTRALLATATFALMTAALPAEAGSRGGTINRNPPTISGTPSTTDVVGTAYGFTPTAYDADGQKLSFSIANKPSWASFNRNTGRLAGTPTAVGASTSIVISVTDGHYTASLPPFGISVVATAPAPASPPSISGTPSTTARVGMLYSFQPTATDPAGLTITYTILNRPGWATFNVATGLLSGTPLTADVGTYGNIVIGADNGTSCSTLAPFSVAVQAWTSGSATLSWMPPTTRTDGSALTNLAGYRIRYGTSPGALSQLLTLTSPSLTDALIENLPPATYYFAVSAYDTTGVESDLSPVLSKTIQ
jgi:hypothetical protein